MRVLFLTTPFDRRWRLDGTRRAIADLAPALEARGVTPLVVAREPSEAPCEAIAIDARIPASFAVMKALRAARADVVHAVFAPRLVTGAFLRALRATGMRVVQTIASTPRRWSSFALAGEPIVATSQASARAMAAMGIEAIEAPMPFDPPREVAVDHRGKGGVLFVGDYEHGDALGPTLRAFASVSTPHGMRPRLFVASRRKSARSKKIEARLARRRDVEVLGEVGDLLPWILAASCVVLPARDTYAKLDHPRALLEAIALGTPIVVGPAPSLAELVVDPAIGSVASEEGELRDAIEAAIVSKATPIEARAAILAPRIPSAVAEIYARIYAG